MEVLLKNKKLFLSLISFLIFVGLSFNVFADDVTITTEDPSVVDPGFTPEIGSELIRGTEAFIGRFSDYTGPDTFPSHGNSIFWRVTITGPEGSVLDPSMVDLDEGGWKDLDEINIETFHYPFSSDENGNLVVVGSCDDPDPEHSNTCDHNIGFSLDTDDEFTNVGRIRFFSNAPVGQYIITYELVDTFGSEEIVLGTHTVTFDLLHEVVITTTDPTTVSGGFTPEIGDFIFPETEAYLGRTSTYTGPNTGLGDPENTIQWKITITGPSALTSDMVDLDEVGFLDPLDTEPNIATFHYPFLVIDGNLVATGSCINPDDHICEIGTDAFSLDENDEFINADRIVFDSSAPLGEYTITYELVDTATDPDTVLNNAYVVTVTLDSTPITVSSASPTILTVNGGDVVEAFSPALGTNSIPDTNYYYGVHAVSSWTDAILNVQWKITITSTGGDLLPWYVELEEVGWFGPGLFGNPGCSIETGEEPCDTGSEFYEFESDGNGGLVAFGSFGWDVDPSDDFTNVDRIRFSDDAPSGTYTITRQLGTFGSWTPISNEFVQTTVVADIDVPLDEGWNLRSTPVFLEDGVFWNDNGIDAVLRFNSETQLWETVTDNSMKPLDALYIHATEDTNMGFLFENDVTSPPVRQLNEQWNLVGAALTDDSSTYIGDVFSAAIYDSEGNRALEVVVSPVSNDFQYSFVWIPRIFGGPTPDNYDEEYVYNFGGYWVFMDNDALLPGFTTTPLPVNGD